MKRIAVLLVLALSLPLTARADDASRREKAKEVLLLVHTDRLLQQMMDAVMKQAGSATQQMMGGKLTPNQQTELDAFQKRLFTLIQSNLSYQSLEPDYIKLYADNFTDEELDGMIAFYKSPTGQAVIEKLPSITTQSIQLGQKRVVALLPQVQQMVADFTKNCTDCRRTAPATHGAAAN